MAVPSSSVKTSMLTVNAMKQEKNGSFSAALDVSKGAFRLTTDIFRKYSASASDQYTHGYGHHRHTRDGCLGAL
jgi:hypothetical protein